MERTVLGDIGLAEAEAQYDEHAKRILSNRKVLARILKGTADEFKELPVEVIAEECIGDDILVSKVRLEPGESNKPAAGNIPGRIIGDRTEDEVINEGKIYYDIRFSAYVPDKEEIIKILVNVEAQKKFHVGYAFVTRGIFYGARMISAQLETEFADSDYSKIKKVYSIWICMNAPDYIGNAISEYSITKKDIVKGIPDVEKDYDKMSIVVICLNRKVQNEDEANELIGMLNILFADNMEVSAKKKILGEQYDMAVNYEVEEVMGYMCNLGEGIYERGVEQGIEKGIRIQRVALIRSNLAKGKSIKAIADFMEADIDFVRIIADKVAENNTITDEELVKWYGESNK